MHTNTMKNYLQICLILQIKSKLEKFVSSCIRCLVTMIRKIFVQKLKIKLLEVYFLMMLVVLFSFIAELLVFDCEA